MSGLLSAAESAIGKLLGSALVSQGGTSGGLTGIIERAGLFGTISAAASAIIGAVTQDLHSGNPAVVAQARRVPQYAIVDLHNDKIVKTLSTRKVYIMLTHRGKSRKGTRVVVVREGKR
jgi:hypothetical protein